MSSIESIKKKYSIRSHSSTAATPTPENFEKFIPWACAQFKIASNIIIKRDTQDMTIHSSSSKIIRERYRTSENKLEMSETSVKLLSTLTTSETEGASNNNIPITASYGKKGSLIEILITTSSGILPIQIFNVLYICLPFHPSLTKLTIKSGINSEIVYEMFKLLHFSNITEICLDDTFVSEGNYYILLTSNNLKSLSLRRCSINDGVCEKIAEKLCINCALKLLYLGSNRITDSGVKAIGNAMRINRVLLHLDLSNNYIGDAGAMNLLNHFMDFELTHDEIDAYKREKMKRFRELYSLIITNEKESIEYNNNKENICQNIKAADSTYNNTLIFDFENATPKVKNININPVFPKNDVTYKDFTYFATGNLKFCSLNLAYNNLGCLSLRKICDVLKYQSNLRTKDATGLLKITLNGNRISCSKEIETINMYLEQAQFSRCTSSVSKMQILQVKRSLSRDSKEK